MPAHSTFPLFKLDSFSFVNDYTLIRRYSDFVSENNRKLFYFVCFCFGIFRLVVVVVFTV